MVLKFISPIWGSAHLNLNDFLKTPKNAKQEIVEMVSDHGLEIVAEHWETQYQNTMRKTKGAFSL